VLAIKNITKRVGRQKKIKYFCGLLNAMTLIIVRVVVFL